MQISTSGSMSVASALCLRLREGHSSRGSVQKRSSRKPAVVQRHVMAPRFSVRRRRLMDGASRLRSLCVRHTTAASCSSVGGAVKVAAAAPWWRSNSVRTALRHGLGSMSHHCWSFEAAATRSFIRRLRSSEAVYPCAQSGLPFASR